MISAILFLSIAAQAAQKQAPIKGVVVPPLPGAAVPAVKALVAPASAAAPAAASAPTAQTQLQAAQPPQKAGSDAEQRAFYERVFSGAAAPAVGSEAAPIPAETSAAPVEPLKADVEKLLTYVSKNRAPEKWAGRLEAVIAAGGIPRIVPTGVFSSKKVIDPIDPDLRAELPTFLETMRIMERGTGAKPWTIAMHDLIYEIGVISQRSASRPALLKELHWYWGTYRGRF